MLATSGNAMTRKQTLLMGLAWFAVQGVLAAQEHRARPAAAMRADTLTAPPTLRNRSAVPGVVEVTLTAAPSRLRP